MFENGLSETDEFAGLCSVTLIPGNSIGLATCQKRTPIHWSTGLPTATSRVFRQKPPECV